MQRVIEITVSPAGESKVETKGYAGGECLQASNWLETALGVVSSEVKTAEFYSGQEVRQQAQQ